MIRYDLFLPELLEEAVFPQCRKTTSPQNNSVNLVIANLKQPGKQSRIVNRSHIYG